MFFSYRNEIVGQIDLSNPDLEANLRQFSRAVLIAERKLGNGLMRPG